MTDEERVALGVVCFLVLAFVVACLGLGWRREPSAGWVRGADALAACLLAYYAALIWLGASSEPPVGFRYGAGRTYLSPEGSRALGLIARGLGAQRLWPAREPFFRLPVLVPLACAAAAFVTVDHDADSAELAKQLEPTLIVLFGAVLAINGFLAVRSQTFIDFVGALVTAAVLVAGEVETLIQVNGSGTHQINWIAAAMVFGFITLLTSTLRGANPPEAQDRKATPTPPQGIEGRPVDVSKHGGESTGSGATTFPVR
jgi:hypothetical protein